MLINKIIIIAVFIRYHKYTTMPSKQKIKAAPPATTQNFPIVSIALSAGGLDTFNLLIRAIAEDSGMAIMTHHNGFISTNGTPGAGSTFSLYFPQ